MKKKKKKVLKNSVIYCNFCQYSNANAYLYMYLPILSYETVSPYFENKKKNDKNSNIFFFLIFIKILLNLTIIF